MINLTRKSNGQRARVSAWRAGPVICNTVEEKARNFFPFLV